MPDEHDLSVGDMVRLKPGFRIMIVEEVYAPLFMFRYRCTWNGDGSHELHDVFRRDQLEYIARKQRAQAKADETDEHETLIAEDVTVKIKDAAPGPSVSSASRLERTPSRNG